MFLRVDSTTIDDAAMVHSITWQESHRAFCSPEFIAEHTPEHQRNYLLEKMNGGSAVWLLAEPDPVGIVSVTANLIEDLYVLPDRQNMGYGTRLLRFALEKCTGRPTLWILENNTGAERLYRRLGFQPTGKRNRIAKKLDEIEFVLQDGNPMD